MKVYISGTRIQIDVDGVLKEKLEQLTGQGAEILIGDSCGTDRCVQEYLASVNYRKVTVYSQEKEVRNNVGGWDVQMVKKEYVPQKTIRMTKEADYGIIIWDGRSKGSFVNLLRFLAHKKSCELYLLKEKIWADINTSEDVKPYIGERGVCKMEGEELFEILKECGCSEDIRRFLRESIWSDDINGMICQAPISLDKKLLLLKELYEKENLPFELFCYFLRDTENEGCINYLETDWMHASDSSFARSYREILKAKEEFYNKESGKAVFCLFRAGCGIREHLMGVFASSDQVKEKLKYKFGSDTDYYRVELWEYGQGGHLEPRYHYYFYQGEICWVIKMEWNCFFREYALSNVGISNGCRAEVETGDIVRIDCCPFELPFHAMIVKPLVEDTSILFYDSFENKWKLDKFFYRSYSGNTGEHRILSVIYRLKSVLEEELSEEDQFLITVKNALGEDEKKMKKFWDTWTYGGKSQEEAEEILKGFL